MTVGANFDVVNGPTVNLNAVFAATDEILLGGNFKYNTGLDEDRFVLYLYLPRSAICRSAPPPHRSMPASDKCAFAAPGAAATHA